MAALNKLVLCTGICHINCAANLLVRTSSRLSGQSTTKNSSTPVGEPQRGDTAGVSAANLPIYDSEPHSYPGVEQHSYPGAEAQGYPPVIKSRPPVKRLKKSRHVSFGMAGLDNIDTEKYEITAPPQEQETSHLTPFLTPTQLAERRKQQLPERPFDGRRTTLKEDWEHFVKWFKSTFYELHYYFEMKVKKDSLMLVERNRLNAWYVTEFNAEIAVAAWVMEMKGAVRYKDQKEWYRLSRRKFPIRQLMDEMVEAVDLSGTNIAYNGLANFEVLAGMTELRLADCPHIDDHCLAKLHEYSGRLEYLDISRCPRVTERGISSLHNVRSLQVVKMEEMPNVKYKELIALMMEEVMPWCKFEGVDYVEKSKQLGIKMDVSLLENKDVKLLDKPDVKLLEEPEDKVEEDGGKQQEEATSSSTAAP